MDPIARICPGSTRGGLARGNIIVKMIDREFAVTLAEPVRARVERGGMVIWKLPYGAQLVLSEGTDDALLMHPDGMTMASFLEPVSSLGRFCLQSVK